MGWSYSPADLATSEKDQVRLEIADTDPKNQLLQDEEILFAISVERNFWSAAARCCEMASRGFLRKADVKLGRAMTIAYTKAAEQYSTMGEALRRKALGSQVPYFGGVYVSDKVVLAMDTNIVAPSFARNMQESPWTGGYTADVLPPIGGGNSVDDGFAFEFV